MPRSVVLAFGLLLVTSGFTAPVPKEAKSPPAPDPDETFFELGTPDAATVIEVGKATVTIRLRPNRLEEVTLPGGQVVQRLRPVDDAPRVYHMHPVLKAGGLSDLAYGRKAYRFTDLKVGDTVNLYSLSGDQGSRWLVAIEIADRTGGELPKPARSFEEWSKISRQLHEAHSRRQQAKAEAEKKDKK